jgi:hypothetical protein
MAGLPRDVRAWACAFCGKLYVRNKIGKERARICCMCEHCRVMPARHIGQGGLCRQCGAKQELAAAEQTIKWAQNLKLAAERLEKARANKGGAV